MNHGSVVNAFWSRLGVSREHVYARGTTDGVTLSLLVDGLPKGAKLDQAELMRQTNAALTRFKQTNRYRFDPEMQQ